MQERKKKKEEDANEGAEGPLKTRAVPFPPALLQRIEEAATAEDRTVVGQVRVLCREALESRDAASGAERAARGARRAS